MTRAVTIGKKPHRNKSVPRSHTSPRQIKLQQQRAAALDYRLQGYAYHRIAKAMGIHASTVHRLVVEAMASMVPAEKIEAVFDLEMQRLDIMQQAVFAEASGGDKAAIDTVLKIMAARARLMGLNRDGSQRPSVHFDIRPSAEAMPDAEEVGIKIEFVRPRPRDDAGHIIEGPKRPTGPFIPRIMPPPDDSAA